MPHSHALAERLRDLRTNRWPGRPVMQRELAVALGLSVGSISAWENLAQPHAPSPRRLADIAHFFATPRSLDGEPPALRKDLDDGERARKEALLSELTALQAHGPIDPQAEQVHPWHFPDGAPVRLVCGRQPGAAADAYADPTNHNFMALSNYADLDALVELLGQVRAQNPDSDVQHRLVDELSSEDLQGHLVVLGNLSRMQDVHEVFAGLDLPVRQVSTDLDGEVFEVRRSPESEPERISPRFIDGRRGHLIEDIGLYLRVPSPVAPGRTLSLCSGVFTRGVLGVARLVADPVVGRSNLDRLAAEFSEVDRYGFLLRVPVRGPYVVTPDLTSPAARLLTLVGVDGAFEVITE